MSIVYIWLIIALVLFIVEILTSGFGVFCFCVGALAAAVMAAFHLALVWQLVAFAILSFIAFIYIRPLLLKLFFKKEKLTPTNGEALIGRVGRVSEDIDPETGKGRVAIDGDDWKAVSAEGTPIAKGAQVKVIARDGLTIKVKVSNSNK